MPAAEAAPRISGWRRRRLGAAVAIVIAAVLVGGMLFLRTWPPFATVMSASMAPTIKTGDVVVLGHLTRPARVGDIIEANVPDDARSRYGYPPVVIHRIVSISPRGQIQTKGDARPTKDPFTVNRRSVTARVVATIPAAGTIFAFLVSPMGLLWLVGGAVLLLGMPLLEKRREQHERERHSVDELHTELRTISADLAELRDGKRTEADALVALADAVEQLAHPAPPAETVIEPEPVPEPDLVAEPDEPEAAAEPAELRLPALDLYELEVHEHDLPELRVPRAKEPRPRPAEQREEPKFPEVIHVRRRSGGIVGSLERHARSLSSRYR